MSDFVKVTTRGEIPDPGKQILEMDDRLVVLFHVGGHFFCVDDVCTDDGGTLGDGCLDGHEIACPRHGAKFDMRDGKAITMPATAATIVHETKVDGDDVFVKLNEEI